MKPYFKVIFNKIRIMGNKLFAGGTINAKGIQILGYNTKIKCSRNGQIYFGDRIISDGRCVIIVDENATLKIDEHVYFNEGMMISCKESVEIGSGCQFGPNVKIFDNDHCFNKMDGVLSTHSSKRIYIGKKCWIGANVTILKGTKIGDNCVIGAGCVVKGEIPNSSIVKQDRRLIIESII